jgi:hypothetical protein
MHDDGTEDDDGTTAPGGWLTYRYRAGGDGAAESAGTIKAPSFASAARRLSDGRLAARVGERPLFLRLRAAGEDEVLMRLHRDAGGRAQVAAVPVDSFQFAPPDLGATS